MPHRPLPETTEFRTRSRLLSFAFLLLAASVAAPTTLADVPDEEAEWPREIETELATIVIYQPQLETFDGDTFTGRAAVAVTIEGEDAPVFGAAWFRSRVSTDRDARMIRVLDSEITEVRFPNATDEEKQRFIEIVESRTPDADLDISLDRVVASLAIVEQERQAAEGLNFDPPVILYTDRPSVLISIDGEPKLQDIEDKLRKVVNTAFLIVEDPKKKRFYLDGGLIWYVAESIDGPWSLTKKVPKKVEKLRTPAAEREARAQASESTDDTIPEIVVATVPTELLVSNGEAEYETVEGSGLLYMSNTEADILMDIDSQQHFVVLSGRWFAAKSLDGPWSYVAPDALPESFAQIPADSPIGHVLVFVAGTDEANEAALDAQIPQTAALKRGRVKLDIEYDGDPQFVPIDGTGLEYAVNTGSSVLRLGGKYYACDQGAWYVGDSPTGPWMVSDHRPEDVDAIPATHPLYNVKYVYVYSSTPEIVYVGYTPAYYGSYVHHGCVVYGTGWYYPYWYGRYYYPRPSTWGFRVSYNPWYGWSFGLSWSNGPFTISIGRYGGGGYWGPRGWYGRPPGYRPGYPGYRPGYRPGYPGNRPGTPGNLPARPGTRPSQPGTRPAKNPGGDNLYNRPGNKDRVAQQPSTRDRASTNIAGDRANNVYSDRDGNVYRRNDNGGWERNTKDGWSPADRAPRDSSAGKGTRPADSGNRSRPSTAPSSTWGGSSQGLNRDYNSRQRGSSSTRSYRSSPSRGGARGGGGRRR